MCLIFFPLVPRNHGQNNVLGIDLDIELGNTEEEFKDDPGKKLMWCVEILAKVDGFNPQIQYTDQKCIWQMQKCLRQCLESDRTK